MKKSTLSLVALIIMAAAQNVFADPQALPVGASPSTQVTESDNSVAADTNAARPSSKTHSHHKATMPEETHQQYIEREQRSENASTSPPQSTHQHHKATMPGASHQEYMDDQDNSTDESPSAAEEPKTHKHSKATMSGASHKDLVEDR